MTPTERRIRKLEQRLRRGRPDPAGLRRLARAYSDGGRHLEAFRTAMAAVRMLPQDGELWLLAGRAALAGQALDPARQCFRQVPGAPPALAARGELGLARVAYEFGKDQDAVAHYRRAIAADPELAPAWRGLGLALKRLGQVDDAIDAFRRALAIDPASPACGGLLMCLRERCDWTGHDALVAAVEQSLERELAAGEHTCVTPSFAQKLPLTAARLLEVNRAQARRILARTEPARRKLTPAPAPATGTTGRPLRVAYLSNGFRDFPQGHLVRDLFRHHDRSRFEILAFDYGGDDGSEFRRDIAAGVDRFVDIAGRPTIEVVQAIAPSVDILVDMKVYSSGARVDIAALRPAPVQVNWLGFPGSSGSRQVHDYLIGDPLVTPPADQAYYEEALVRLPDCYAPVDPGMLLPEREPAARAEEGLPAGRPVLCAFNGADKLSPADLDGWLEILRRAPDAVLWLYAPSDGVADRLAQEVRSRGGDPARLHFASHRRKREHLRRLAAADLMLDCHPYGAHTTAGDALLAGVPVLTWAGPTFASRVASSYLRAADLPELVCADHRAYIERAVALAKAPGQLAALRDRVRDRVVGSPLLDMPRFAAGLERAFTAMWERHLAGGAPAPIDVEMPG